MVTHQAAVLSARRSLIIVVAFCAALSLGACASGSDAAERVTPSVAADQPSTLRTLQSIPGDAPLLKIGEKTSETDAYTRFSVSYRSGDATITGALAVPKSSGRHPGIVLVHGLIDPNDYAAGSGLVREQDYFASAGFVVLSTDLRSAKTELDPANVSGVDMGSTLDTINAVHALATSDLNTLDRERIGILGHSLGGLLVMNTLVTQPGLVDAAVALAPASTEPLKNVERFLKPGTAAYEKIMTVYGTPEESPAYWRDLSPLTFIDRIEEPLLIEHGTADTIAPFEWSEQTVEELETAGKDVEFVTLEGEDHIFDSHWDEAMTTALRFLKSQLGG